MFAWSADAIARMGYAGIVLLMFLENLLPPLPSELIMPLAGFNAARGNLSLPGVIVAGTMGSLLGSVPWFLLGRFLGRERLERLADRYGRWLTVSGEEIGTASRWFERHGKLAVLFGRLVPTVRTLISVPAGIVGMPFSTFLVYSTLGTLGWTGVLAGAGYVLEAQYTRVADCLDLVSKAVVGLIVVTYVYRLIAPRGGGKKPGRGVDK